MRHVEERSRAQKNRKRLCTLSFCPQNKPENMQHLDM